MKLATFLFDGKQHVGLLTEQGLVPFAADPASDVGHVIRVSASGVELPAGAKGLLLQTRLNGKVVQSANTDDMIHDVASLISTISEAITLQTGDVIVAGTPSGIGWAREPKLLMRHGDVVEVSIEKVGVLTNPVRDESARSADAGKR